MLLIQVLLQHPNPRDHDITKLFPIIVKSQHFDSVSTSRRIAISHLCSQTVSNSNITIMLLYKFKMQNCSSVQMFPIPVKLQRSNPILNSGIITIFQSRSQFQSNYNIPIPFHSCKIATSLFLSNCKIPLLFPVLVKLKHPNHIPNSCQIATYQILFPYYFQLQHCNSISKSRRIATFHF